MNGILEITLNGQKERLHFNNFARDVLRPFFIPEGKTYITEGELMKAIINKWQENETALLKMLVYAGIYGDSLAGKYFNSRLSPEYIGKYIAEAPNEELLEVWKVFLAAQGFNLEPEENTGEVEEKELTPEEEKKDEDNLAFAFGEIGLTPHEYYCMTPAEYILKRRGYLLKKSKEWEETRLIAHNIYLNRHIKGRHKSATEWLPLPTDRFREPDVDLEQMQEEWEIIKARQTA